MTIAKEMSKYKLYLVEYRSDGTEGAPNQKANIYFSMENGMGIMN
jgi:hypothetical protein